MRNCAPLPLVLLLACVPFEPPGSEPTTSVAATESGSSAASGTTSWQLPARERDKTPSSTSTSTTTTTSGPPPATSDGGASSDTGTGPPLDLSALQIAELHPDPNGKDGGPDSPEFLEIAHVGELPIDLTGLEIDARAWPTLSADALGLAGQVLLPGERLLVLRFAAAADVPDPPVAAIDNGVRVAFASSEGLRNADGGVLLHVGDIMGDALIHGAAQPAPWDARGLWLGAPAAAPGPGESLCRGSAIDHDDASDWSACPPSPGTATELEAGTTCSVGSSVGCTTESSEAPPSSSS